MRRQSQTWVVVVAALLEQENPLKHNIADGSNKPYQMHSYAKL